MPASLWFAQSFDRAFSGAKNWSANDMRLALLGAGYTPDRAVHEFFSDVAANEVAATGYVAGGSALTGEGITVTAANAWATTWAATTAYAVGFIVRPTVANGFVYAVSVAGTSSGAQPTWPTTVGQTVVDGGVTWTCMGRAVVAFMISPTSVAWTITGTLATRWGVVYDRTPATDAARPLMFLVDLDATQSVTNATFTITLGSQGVGTIFVP